MLPGWGDEAIMDCDLARLRIAVDAAVEQSNSDWRQRARIAGIKVQDPVEEPEDDEAFNEQLRATMTMFRKVEE